MVTEEQAKTKACFRAASFGGSQQLANGPGPNCIGSACMAWRFAGEQSERGEVYEESDTPDERRPANVPASWIWTGKRLRGQLAIWVHRWTEPEAEHQARKVGFCGLAGAPQ